MKSLRELQEELTGIRLSGGSNSLWAIGATVNERARLALIDAVRSYKFPINMVEYSVKVAANAKVTALPHIVKQVTKVEMWDSSLDSKTELRTYHFAPTMQTAFLHIENPPKDAARWLEVHYITEIDHIPRNARLNDDVTAEQSTLKVTPASVYDIPSNWAPSGYFELSSPSWNTRAREIVYYRGTDTSLGFHGLVRGVHGTPKLAWSVDNSVIVSPVIVASPQAISVITAEAEASMYAFWQTHRAQYQDYVTAAGIQQLDITDVLALTRTLEDRAERRYRRNMVPTQPGRGRVQRRRDK